MAEERTAGGGGQFLEVKPERGSEDTPGEYGSLLNPSRSSWDRERGGGRSQNADS